jgi:type II secretory pathway component PulF
MPEFVATVLDHRGRRSQRSWAAPDRASLHASLRANGLWPLRVREAAPRFRAARVTLPVREFVQVLRHLEMLLRAGVTADVALAQLGIEAGSGRLAFLLTTLHQRVSQGRPIHEACAEFPRLFPEHVQAVIAAAESSARLPDSLAALAEHLLSMDEIRRTARRALVYPALVTTATGGLVALLCAQVIPRFAEIFLDMRLPLPGITEVVIAVGRAFQATWPWMVVATAGGAFALATFGRTARGRYLIDGLLLRTPVLGPTLGLLTVARFAAHLRLLHDAGIPLLVALEHGERFVGHGIFRNEIRLAREVVSQGRPLAQALPTGRCFPPFVGLCLKAGELSGQLGRALGHVADHATREARERIAYALLLLEPLLLVGLTVVVGVVALSFFLPLFHLFAGLRAH